ncbi:synaptotagmin [Phormidium sp. LEGE 05292]|nr:synaptotagmin [Phormidium sp. LEGE 05292]
MVILTAFITWVIERSADACCKLISNKWRKGRKAKNLKPSKERDE